MTLYSHINFFVVFFFGDLQLTLNSLANPRDFLIQFTNFLNAIKCIVLDIFLITECIYLG